jgi:hypothetical protein
LGDPEDGSTGCAYDPRGDVQEPVAQLLRLGQGALAVEERGLRPGEQVDAGQSEFEPRLADGELAGWEPTEP